MSHEQNYFGIRILKESRMESGNAIIQMSMEDEINLQKMHEIGFPVLPLILNKCLDFKC